MADVTLAVTTTPVAGAVAVDGLVAYEALDAGSAIYRRADGTYAKSRANALATARVDGFAISTAGAAGQRISMVSIGDLTTTGLTTKTDYFLSAAVAGKICPRADLVSTNIVVYVGTANSATVLRVHPVNTGIVI